MQISRTGITLLLALAWLTQGRAAAADELAAVASAVAGADIVIIGEVHDNPEHHRRQAWLIRHLQPAAVAFEMLNPEQAAIANSDAARDATLASAMAWEGSGWPPWPLYQPVFEAIGDATVYGMALPAGVVNRAVTEGAASVFGREADRFGLADALPAAQQQARELLQQEAHCGMLPASLLPGMVEAQRLRDAAFARTALQALEESGKPVVVITGTGHARGDWGMPAAIRIAAPGVVVANIGQFEASIPEEGAFEQALVSEPAPREDPCKALVERKQP